MLFYHVVITVCACTFVTCTLININRPINFASWAASLGRFRWSRECGEGGFCTWRRNLQYATGECLSFCRLTLERDPARKTSRQTRYLNY